MSLQRTTGQPLPPPQARSAMTTTAAPVPSPVLGHATAQAATQAGVKPAEQQAAQKLRASVTVADLDAFLKARAGKAPQQRGLVPSVMKLLGAPATTEPPSAEAVALHHRLGEAVSSLGAIYADGLVTEGELSLLQAARGQLRAVLGLAEPGVLNLMPKDVRERVQNQLLEPLSVLDQAATRRADRLFAAVVDRDEAALRTRLSEPPVFRHVDVPGLLSSGLTPFSLARYEPGDFVGVPRSDGSVDTGVVVGKNDRPPGLRVEVLDRRSDSLGLKTLSAADVASANPLKIGDYVEAPGLKVWVTGTGAGGVTGTVQDTRGQVRTVDAATVARIAVEVTRAHQTSPQLAASFEATTRQPTSPRGMTRPSSSAAASVGSTAAVSSTARTSRQSLERALDDVWRDRGAFLSGQKQVYSDVYNAVAEANPLSRSKASYLGDVAALAQGRPAGSVSNTQSFGGDGDAISDVVNAWNDGAMPATGAFGKDLLEKTFFRFERPNWQPDLIRQRVYLNTAADHATDVMAFVVRQVLDHPERFPGVEMAKLSGPAAVSGRSENIVLYTRDDDASRRVLDAVASYRAQHPGHFRSGTPAFTETVAPGVAVGDEPAVGNGRMSFGSLRASVIETALHKAHAQGLDRAGFGRLVDEGLRGLHVDPARPHKNLASMSS
jgi:hypothetical protein